MGSATGAVPNRRAAPQAFYAFAATECAARFSLAGIKSILALVLIDHVLADGARDVLGAGALQHFFQRIFGPLSTSGLASQLYGVTAGLLYLSVPLGGILGDRLARRGRAIYLAGACILAGLALMASRVLFLPGLALFAVGAGVLKGNLSVIVGALFADATARRRGYAIYLGFLNGGMAVGPLVCGALEAKAGWRYACAAAAGMVLLGLLSWHLADRQRGGGAVQMPQTPSDRVANSHRRGDWALLVATLAATYLCFAAYEQLGNMFMPWARARVNLQVAGWTIPTAWLLALDGLFTIALIPLAQFGLRLLARRGWVTEPLWEIALGCVACAVGNLVLVCAELVAGGQALPLVVVLAYLACIDLAIVLVWPAGLSLVTAAAAPRDVGLWVGLFYLHGFAASLWIGPVGALYGRMPAAQFWSLHAAIALLGAVPPAALALWRARPAADQATTTSACAKARA
ncbi:MFS transporter [Sphingomonas xinjiangensis]|uniref:POT family proton-dependent oligopeptide transporter n=1 Tax=Sphingomonas xinjiangensis TaxID=643568 RepID=A0A840YFV1_9SPHN|nr:MFS transporter [Sphingomonas xinjiangensis]MBB5711704.1 POT family proton-dependent oligopeptide transporter [Sphingomonas xinjiangensis]